MNSNKRTIFLCLILATALWAGACNDKVVCPAFESYYMHDLEGREQFFSYFGEDSLPKADLATARRNKNGLGHKSRLFAYRTKEATLRTIPMEDVMPAEEDELDADSLTPVDQQYIDELQADSTLVASADTVPTLRERPTGPGGRPQRINTDQHYYNRRFGELLLNPIPPPVPMRKLPKEERQEAKKANKDRKKKDKGPGLFSKLFGKKGAETDSLAVETPPEEEPNFVPFEEDEGEGEEEDDDSEF